MLIYKSIAFIMIGTAVQFKINVRGVSKKQKTTIRVIKACYNILEAELEDDVRRILTVQPKNMHISKDASYSLIKFNPTSGIVSLPRYFGLSVYGEPSHQHARQHP